MRNLSRFRPIDYAFIRFEIRERRSAIVETPSPATSLQTWCLKVIFRLDDPQAARCEFTRIPIAEGNISGAFDRIKDGRLLDQLERLGDQPSGRGELLNVIAERSPAASL